MVVSMTEEQDKAFRQQRNNELHARNMIQDNKSNTPQILEFLAEIKDEDSPDLDDESLDHMLSKVVSTANLSKEEVEAIEWHNEIAMMRRRHAHPPNYGLTGYLRAFAFRDSSEYRLPIDQMDIIKQEGHGLLSKLAATRSEEFIGVETSTRDIRESIVNEEQSASGGLWQRMRNR